MNVSRVVIAGLYGEGGKTTVATGIMGAFTKKGLNVQAFKSGPDHIDATYHTEVTKKPSRHLRRVAHVAKNSARELRKII